MMGYSEQILELSGMTNQNYDFNVIRLSDGTVQLIKKWHWDGFEEKISISEDEFNCMQKIFTKTFNA